MCPTSLRSVRPGFGTSDDLPFGIRPLECKGWQSTWGQSLVCGCGRGDLLISHSRMLFLLLLIVHLGAFNLTIRLLQLSIRKLSCL
jgi:hypothetical protein